MIHTRTPRGGVLLDPATKAYFVLNETGEALFVALRSAPATVDALAQALLAQFDVDDVRARDDVRSFLGELEGLGLVTLEAAG